MSVALRSAVAADIVRPSMHWLLGGGAANNHFTQALAAERDPPASPGCKGCWTPIPSCRPPPAG